MALLRRINIALVPVTVTQPFILPVESISLITSSYRGTYLKLTGADDPNPESIRMREGVLVEIYLYQVKVSTFSECMCGSLRNPNG